MFYGPREEIKIKSILNLTPYPLEVGEAMARVMGDGEDKIVKR